MNTIKWELEDLSFATLYPKVYDEIVRLVADRAPAREEYLAGVRDAGHRATCRGREDQGHGHRPAQALLLDLPEDDRPRPRLRRHLRPRGRPRPGRLGPGLLRGAGRDARALEPGARPVQGLHRDAQVQHVPVAAHHGDRSRAASRSRSRSAPTTCTAGPSTASPRTGSTRRRQRRADTGRRCARATRARSTTWPGCASCWTGSRRPPTRGSSSTRCGSRSTPARSSSSRPRAT